MRKTHFITKTFRVQSKYIKKNKPNFKIIPVELKIGEDLHFVIINEMSNVSIHPATV